MTAAQKFINNPNIYKKIAWYIYMYGGSYKTIFKKELVIFEDNSALVLNTTDCEWELAVPKIKKNGNVTY